MDTSMSVVLKPLELNSLLQIMQRQLEPDAERRYQERRPYPAIQLIAPCDGAGLPTQESLRDIRCHDLSCSGISFYWAGRPPFRFAVIGLGQAPDLTYIKAQKVREQCVGTDVYLVGCKFLGRFTWPDF